MKEDENVPIILGRPLFNTARALVDVCESKLTWRVGKEVMTFGVEEGFEKSKNPDEVFFMDEENELEELEKLMEEEVQTGEKPKEVMLTMPRVSIPMNFEVFAYTTPKIQDEEVCERKKDKFK